MKPFWTQLLYLHGHALPHGLRWREDVPKAGRRAAAAVKPMPPMLRWREVLRAALIS